MNVTYNGTTFSSLGINNPYLLMDENMIYVNGKWINQKDITLEGNITGNFSSINSKQLSLINLFNTDFKTLQVDGADSFDYCRINNIFFPASTYENILNYSVSLTSYGDDFNSLNSGVLDPVNEISINENEDGIFSVTHNMSARGINKSTAALEAAKTFINSLKGISQYGIGSLRQFNTNIDGTNYVLKSYVENIDRINGVYSLKEDYLFNSSLNTDISLTTGIIKYTVDYTSGTLDSYATASVKGTIDYSKDFYPDSTTLDEIGSLIGLGDLENQAATVLGSANQIPESFNINVEKNKVAFDVKFTNNVIIQPYFDYKLSYKYDKIYSKTIAEITGPVIVKGNLKERNTQLDSFLAGIANIETYLYNLTNAGYTLWSSIVVGQTYALRQKPTSLSVKRSLPKGTLEISAIFDDGVSAANGFTSNSFSISYNPPIDIIYPKPTCTQNGCYMLVDPRIKTLPNLSIRADGNVIKGQELSAQANIISLKNTIKSQCATALFSSQIAESENVSVNSNSAALQASIDSAYTSKTTNTIHRTVVRSIT
jgi:hypothetical protein